MRNNISINIIALTFMPFAILISQGEFEEYKRQQEKEFSEYEESVTQQYKQFELEEKLAFEQYKREVEEKWEEFKSPSKKEYVQYSENKESRASVDFENGTVTIEVLVKEDKESEESVMVNEKLQKSVQSLINTDGEDGKPLLAKQLESPVAGEVTPGNISKISKELIKKENIIIDADHKGTDDHKRVKYMVIIPLKENHLSERAKRYEKIVIKYSKKFKVDPAIVFAVIETESAFNPKAKSHIPAYGLMQLVPKSGARDAYLYVYKKDKYLSKRYLYTPENNIKLGCAYLAKIRYVYYRDITDDENAYICTIPAYNTGIGNVSKTLSGTTKLKPAAEVANNMASEELYNKLVKELKYKEARDYLQRVWERKDKYKI